MKITITSGDYERKESGEPCASYELECSPEDQNRVLAAVVAALLNETKWREPPVRAGTVAVFRADEASAIMPELASCVGAGSFTAVGSTIHFAENRFEVSLEILRDADNINRWFQSLQSLVGARVGSASLGFKVTAEGLQFDLSPYFYRASAEEPRIKKSFTRIQTALASAAMVVSASSTAWAAAGAEGASSDSACCIS